MRDRLIKGKVYRGDIILPESNRMGRVSDVQLRARKLCAGVAGRGREVGRGKGVRGSTHNQ